jgi:hypothetical protein
VAVAVLGIAPAGHVWTASPKRVVLLGDVLGQVGRNHLLEVLRRGGFRDAVLAGVFSAVDLASVAHAAGESFVVVALQQGGVGIGDRCNGSIDGRG